MPDNSIASADGRGEAVWLNHACLSSRIANKAAAEVTLAELRRWIASWVGNSTGTSATVESTSAACDAAIMALARESSLILHSANAHPTITQSAHAAAKFVGGSRDSFSTLSYEVMDIPKADEMAFARCLAERICGVVGNQRAVLVLDHVTFDHGLRLPISDISKRLKASCPNLLILVDGAQAVGLWPPPGGDFDAYIGCFHKYAGGPPGAGFLWIAEPFEVYLPSHLQAIGGRMAYAPVLPTLDVAKWNSVVVLLHGLDLESAGARVEKVSEFNRGLAEGLGNGFGTLGRDLDEHLRSHISSFEFRGAAQACRVTESLRTAGFDVQQLDRLVRLSPGRETPATCGYEVGQALARLMADDMIDDAPPCGKDK